MIFAAFAYLLSARLQKEIDQTLTHLPAHQNELALRVINLSGETVTGAFGSKQPEILPDPLKTANIIQNGDYSSVSDPMKECRFSGSQRHVSSQECVIVSKNAQREEKYLWFDYEGSDERQVRKYFVVDEDEMVWNLAVLAKNRSMSYPGWSKKDPSGRATITLINVTDKQFTVTFRCNCIVDPDGNKKTTAYRQRLNISK